MGPSPLRKITLMKGRKPTPSHLKLVTGNPSKRPINAREPQIAADLFAPPEWFNDAQRAVWTYYIASAPSGMLKACDMSVLAALCVACVLHQHAVVALGKDDELTVVAGNGTLIASPYLRIIARQSEIVLRACSELGFSPTSRSRVVMGATSGPRDEFFDD